MAACFLNAKIGDKFKINGNDATYVKVQTVKGGKSCKCKTMANAIQLGYEDQAKLEQGTWNDYKDVPVYAKAFAGNYEILPPVETTPIIIVGFPAVGKTTFTKQTLFAEELVDAAFQNRNFPNLFKSKVTIDLPKVEFLIIPFEERFRKALREDGHTYTLVYPDKDLKGEYINRYQRNRSMAQVLEQNWDSYITSCEADDCDKIVLKSREFLTREIISNE